MSVYTNFWKYYKNLPQRSILISSMTRVNKHCKLKCSILTSKTQEQTVKYFFVWCTSTYSQRTRFQILWELCIINFYSTNSGFMKWITDLWSRQRTLQHVQPRHLKKAWMTTAAFISKQLLVTSGKVCSCIQGVFLIALTKFLCHRT